MSITTQEYKKINKLAPEGLRYCRDCEDYRPVEKFAFRNPKQKGTSGLNTRCRHHASLYHYNRNVAKDPTVRRIRPPLIEGNKVCTRCDEEKPLVDFEKTGGVNGKCKPCAIDVRILQNYNISWEDYLNLLKEQDYRCANPGCRKHYDQNMAETKGRRMAVDHDHSCCPGLRSCGKCVRGLLCSICNLVEGMICSDPHKLIGLIKYLGYRPEDYL